MIRGIKSFVGNLANRMFTSTAARYLPIKSSEDEPSCECSITASKVKSYVLNPDNHEKIESLYKEGQACQKVKELKTKWSSYNLTDKTDEVECQLYKVLKDTLPLVEASEHVKGNEPLGIGATTDLSAFIAEEGKVNLAGEGGGIVGKKSYWECILPDLQSSKERPLKIVSIGGAVGFDAEKTADVFKKEGFNVEKPVVMDPNGLAAYLGSLRGRSDHYPMTSQKYFPEFFSKQENDLCIFHLGTTLNVLPEDVAVSILEDLGKNSARGDVVSLLLVDEVQFTTGNEPKQHLEISKDVNRQGFAKILYKQNGEHYKTIVKDSTSFQEFMTKLGFVGSVDKIKSRGVTFLCYRRLKG